MKSRLFLLFFPTLVLLSCARPGSLSGGAKDETPPRMLSAVPPNKSVHFDKKKFRVYFDEYIKLKDLQQNLIISPPLKHRPRVYPSNSAKYLEVRILDTLKPATTYRFDFGGSVVDNNEGNPYGDLQYVFSTGAQLDSLQVSGVVTDALQRHLPPNTRPVAMLYRIDTTYNDSTLYQRVPDYTAFADSTGAFRIPFVRAGDYRLYAMTDASKDLRFQAQSDEIAFFSDTLHLKAADSTTYKLRLFKEVLPFRVLSPEQPQKGLINFSFKGDSRDTKVELTPARPDFKTLFARGAKPDTLHYWHPFPVGDTLHFHVYHQGQVVDTLEVRILPHPKQTEVDKDQEKDSLVEKLSLTAAPLSSPEADYNLHTQEPLIALDSTKIRVFQDSLPIPFSARVDSSRVRVVVTFDKKPDTQYRFEALPGAFTGFFGAQNDSLNNRFSTRKESDFAGVKLKLAPPPAAPFFLDLLDEKDALVRSRYIADSTASEFDFKYLNPGKYYFRIRVDKNRNERWDTGNAYKRIQAEPVYFYPGTFELRDFWTITENWKLPH